MRILFIASECAPIAKVGGLADVVGSLPKALKKLGVEASVAIPFYQSIALPERSEGWRRTNVLRVEEKIKLIGKDFSVIFNGKKEPFELWQTFLPPGANFPDECVSLYLIKNDNIYGKNIYFEKDATPTGCEEEAASFLFLSVAGIKLAEILEAEVLHCHDWHTAIAPFLAGKEKKLKTVLTIHNLQYQGIYNYELVNQFLNTAFADSVNCLETGILNADLITTVSPSYAKEILTKEFGAGLEKTLKERKTSLFGVLNGLDIEKFNPASDTALDANYSSKNLSKKDENKAFLQNRFFKKINPEIPVLAVVSRLTAQKGIDLIIEIFDQLMAENIQFVLLGQGVNDYEKFFKEKTIKFPQKFFAKIGFDDKLAQQIYGGADIFLMPSLFEPCGLGQLIAMRYGTVPLARAVGGIEDTVKNVQMQNEKPEGTGFLFEKYDAGELLKTIRKALLIFKDKKIWKQIQINGMNQDFSWEKAAKIYVSLYEKLLK